MFARLMGLLAGGGGPCLLVGVFVAGLGMGIAGTWKVADWIETGAAAERLEVYDQGLRLINAANEGQRLAELADRDRALEAAEAAAEAERTRRDDLEGQLADLRDAPVEDDQPLSPTGQRFFDGLREGK